MQKEAGVILEPHNTCTELESGCNGHVLRSNDQTLASPTLNQWKNIINHMYCTELLTFILRLQNEIGKKTGLHGLHIIRCEFRNVKCIVLWLLCSVCIIQCD